MPNWCDNSMVIDHKDPSMMFKLVEGINKGKMFSTFFPVPENEDCYSWSIDNWGTKWEPTAQEDAFIAEDDSLYIIFETAWGPPIRFYKNMKNLGFKIDATYHECGMQFAGRYTTENGDDYYEYDFDDENWRDLIDDSDVMEILENEYEYYLQVKAEEEAEAAEDDE